MQSEVPDPTDPTSSTQEQDYPSQSTLLQQDPSSRPSRSPGAESSNAPGSSTGRRTLNRPPRLRGSSRDTTEMQRSTTPEASSADAIKYTRTGRVSKATKGHRVHHCEECGKTYTRAEHLRRHQQNHKPGAFPCDYPGCGRSFYREDLLVRHKARHNDPLNPPSRRHSLGSQSSAPDPRSIPAGSSQAPGLALGPTSTTDPSLVAPELQPTTSDSDAQQSNVSSRYHLSEVFPEPTSFTQVFDELSLTPKRVPIPPNELPVNVPVTVDGPTGFGPFSNPWDLSSPVSPPTYHAEYDYESADETAGLPYYQPQFPRMRNSSDTSFLGYGLPHSTSRSPVSAGSSTIYLSQWPYQAGCNASFNNGAYVDGFGYMNHQIISAFPYGDTRALTADTRDFMEQHDLALVGPGQQGLSFDEATTHPDEQRYLNDYWESVHELYSVLHKPTFDEEATSPLLNAAILALGGQVSGERADLSNSRTLHEKCIKVLKKRTAQQTHTYRVCDMQAIVLIEVYSIFKSRRPPLQLSKNFENVYRLLANDVSALMPTPTDTPMENSSFGDSLRNEAASKQRLLLTCYTLDQQHAVLFGRLPLDVLGGASQDLPFPEAQSGWDATPGSEAESPSDEPCYERVSDVLKASSYMTEPSLEPYDAFRSTLLMASMCQSLNGMLEWTDGFTDPPMLLATEQSPRCRLVFHTLMLCKNAQMRDLLAVAGESWVMAEKMSTQAEHTAAQIETREWACKTFAEDIPAFGFEVPIQRALTHAFAILAIHQQDPRAGVLFQEWAVYLAVVVIWARVYVSRVDERHPRISIPSATEPRPSPIELNQAAASLIQRAATPLMGWAESRTLLLWAKMKIEKYDVPHTCGLTSGALDVLGKLVMRGNEDGWF